MSLINTEIKPFTANAFKDGKFFTVSEANLKGKWSVVFFYPADFTFVCPTELEDLADNYAEFQKLGVEIYSVSTDTHFAHKAWHDTSDAVGKIKYTMVGDPTGVISRNFGVLIEDVGLADRGTLSLIPKARSRLLKSMLAASDATVVDTDGTGLRDARHRDEGAGLFSHCAHRFDRWQHGMAQGGIDPVLH